MRISLIPFRSVTVLNWLGELNRIGYNLIHYYTAIRFAQSSSGVCIYIVLNISSGTISYWLMVYEPKSICYNKEIFKNHLACMTSNLAFTLSSIFPSQILVALVNSISMYTSKMDHVQQNVGTYQDMHHIGTSSFSSS